MDNIKNYTDRVINSGCGSLTLRVQDSKLKGNSITINGFKHSMVQIICFSIAYNVKVKIANAPNVIDTHVFCALIKDMGGYARFSNHTLYINPTKISNFKIKENLSKLIHGSLYLMPALLVRCGKFEFCGAGGCQIGDEKVRPQEHLIDIMTKFGADIQTFNDTLKGSSSCLKEIKTIDILEYSTNPKQLEGALVGGATKTAILLSLNQEYVEILNPYIKTDVLDVLRFIQELGKEVIVDKDKIIIKNKIKTTTKVIKFKLTQCVSEIITYITFAVLNNISIKIKHLDRPRIELGLKPDLALLKDMNVNLCWNKNTLKIYPNSQIKSQNITILPTTIQSDHHPFFALMLTKGNKESSIIEEVWKNRFEYVKNLNKFDIRLVNENNRVTIQPSQFSKKENIILESKDVRTAAVTLLGAITSHSSVSIINCEHLFRGYDSIIKNLQKLGVKIFVEENTNENSFYC